MDTSLGSNSIVLAHQHGGQFRLVKTLDEPGAFDHEGEVNVIGTVEQGFCVGLSLGDDHVGGVEGVFRLLAEKIQLCYCYQIAVVDDPEGNPHRGGILPGGVVEGRAAPAAEGDL